MLDLSRRTYDGEIGYLHCLKVSYKILIIYYKTKNSKFTMEMIDPTFN